MQIKSIVAGAAIALVAGLGAASAGEQFTYLEDVKAISMTNTQMDKVTAGNLLLPNGKVIFGDPDFSNQGTGDDHPNFFRSEKALDATFEYNGPVVPPPGSGSNEGPWSAGVMSTVISICGSGFVACP